MGNIGNQPFDFIPLLGEVSLRDLRTPQVLGHFLLQRKILGFIEHPFLKIAAQSVVYHAMEQFCQIHGTDLRDDTSNHQSESSDGQRGSGKYYQPFILDLRSPNGNLRRKRCGSIVVFGRRLDLGSKPLHLHR